MKQALVVGLIVGAMALAACSSSSDSGSTQTRAGFCAAAKSIQAENSKPVGESSPAQQRKTGEAQIAKLKAAATPAEGKGWADAASPMPLAATGSMDAALRADCSLSVDIFGRTVSK